MSLYQDSERHHRGPTPTASYAEHPSDEKRRLARINGEHLTPEQFEHRCDVAEEWAREERFERELAWEEGS